MLMSWLCFALRTHTVITGIIIIQKNKSAVINLEHAKAKPSTTVMMQSERDSNLLCSGFRNISSACLKA